MTPHFKLETDPKLTCSCGCGMLPKQDFMDKIEQLRAMVGFPLPVTSAARCPDYNSKVSSTGRTGPHTTGRAIDFGVSGSKAYTLLSAALQMGFMGIGVNQKGAGSFIHIDDIPNSPTSPRPFIWSYP
jgi:uncharacterized protein YcbK (DUF882 family)